MIGGKERIQAENNLVDLFVNERFGLGQVRVRKNPLVPEPHS